MARTTAALLTGAAALWLLWSSSINGYYKLLFTIAIPGAVAASLPRQEPKPPKYTEEEAWALMGYRLVPFEEQTERVARGLDPLPRFDNENNID